MNSELILSESVLKSNFEQLGPQSTIQRIFEQSCAQRGMNFPKIDNPRKIYWDADHYGLSGLKQFCVLSIDEKQKLLEALNEFNLHEACFVENLGYRFNAKMILHSKSLEERSMFANFAADEAAHLHSILPFTQGMAPLKIENQPMIHLLSQTIEESSAAPTSFLIQVILEGFGLAHYSTLGKNCLDDVLQKVIQKIVKDEAFHHAGGKAVFALRGINESETKELEDLIFQVTRLFCQWPHPTMRAFVKLGFDDPRFLRNLIEDLRPQEKSLLRIQYIQKLIDLLPAEKLNQLQNRGAFQIPDNEEILKSFLKSPINPAIGG